MHDLAKTHIGTNAKPLSAGEKAPVTKYRPIRAYVHVLAEKTKVSIFE